MPTKTGRPTMKERQLAIWRGMSPAQRDMLRFQTGRIPEGESWEPETELGEKIKAMIIAEFGEFTRKTRERALKFFKNGQREDAKKIQVILKENGEDHV